MNCDALIYFTLDSSTWTTVVSSEGLNSKMKPYLNLQSHSLALIWHDLSPLKSRNFKIQAQENNEVWLFEEITNVSAPSE
jgi:hypothetical protein